MPISRTKIQELSQYWSANRDFIRYNAKILNIYEGQLKTYLSASIQKDFTSPEQQREMIQRAPTINILRSVISKLAKVYVLPVRRVAKTNQKVFDQITHKIDLDTVMNTADEMMTLHKGCFLEPFVDNGNIDVRVVPLDRALPYSDDPVNPMRPTAVLKLLGREKIDPNDFTFTDDQGVITDPYNDRANQDIIMVYTDEYVFVMTEGGMVASPKKLAMYLDMFEEDVLVSPDGLAYVTNDLGKIPFAYLNRSKFSLVPVPDNDLYDMTLLIPKLMADLNYAVKYQASSIMVATDAQLPERIQKKPGVIVQIESRDNSERQAKLEVIKPSIDINPVVSLIQSQLIMWLESRGLKPGSAGKTSEQRASGLAKVIDSADATSERLSKIKILSKFEKRELMPLISDFYRWAMDNRDISISGNPVLTTDLELTTIDFPDQRPLQTMDDRKNLALDLHDRDLATAEQVVSLIFPHMPETDKTKWVNSLNNASQGISRLQVMETMLNEQNNQASRENTDTAPSESAEGLPDDSAETSDPS